MAVLGWYSWNAAGSYETLSYAPLQVIDSPKSAKEKACLEEALWYESRSESPLGIAAVLSVIHNRKLHPSYPKSYCAVIYQSMQFSYRNNVQPGIALKPIPKSVFEPKAVIISEMAEMAIQEKFQSILPQSVIYYTTTKVQPSWSKGLKVYTTIDNHRFYEEK